MDSRGDRGPGQMNDEQNAQQEAAIDMATFLVEIPPGRRVRVSDAMTEVADRDYHCIRYRCRNCEESQKVYAIAFEPVEDTAADLRKLGEQPPFGPPLPSKLISMVREDRELFAKGQRAENQGLGIAAFAYYRRIVENQKNRLLDEIRKVAERENPNPELLAQIEAAKQERKFAAAVDKIKRGLPSSIAVHGTNPLTLLYGVLSANLHEESDESCLKLATAVRVVLSEFADRLSVALRDDQQLKVAVSTLAEHAATKKPSS